MKQIMAAVLAISLLAAIPSLLQFSSEQVHNTLPRGQMTPNAETKDAETKDAGKKETEKEDLSCDAMNWKEKEDGTKDVINDYLFIAETKDGRYDPQKALDEFLAFEDAEIQTRIEEFEGQSFGCDLTKRDVPSSIQDHNIEDPQTFTKRQWGEFRKIECAFYAMKESPLILCPPEVALRDQVIECDRLFRERMIVEIIDNLRISLEVALAQVHEIINAWPIHKRIECLNEEIADQRQLMIDFLDVFSKLPEAFINASQSR